MFCIVYGHSIGSRWETKREVRVLGTLSSAQNYFSEKGEKMQEADQKSLEMYLSNICLSERVWWALGQR